MSPILQMTADEWDRVHRVNIRGVFLCLREAARAMVAAGQPGAIVATGSVSGIVSDRGIVNYSTSKAAVHQLVRVAAAEMGHHGIRVNAIAPGCTDTPMFAVTDQLPGYRELVSERAALGRVGTADDIAAAIVALVAARLGHRPRARGRRRDHPAQPPRSHRHARGRLTWRTSITARSPRATSTPASASIATASVFKC